MVSWLDSEFASKDSAQVDNICLFLFTSSLWFMKPSASLHIREIMVFSNCSWDIIYRMNKRDQNQRQVSKTTRRPGTRPTFAIPKPASFASCIHCTHIFTDGTSIANPLKKFHFCMARSHETKIRLLTWCSQIFGYRWMTTTPFAFGWST